MVLSDTNPLLERRCKREIRPKRPTDPSSSSSSSTTRVHGDTRRAVSSQSVTKQPRAKNESSTKPSQNVKTGQRKKSKEKNGSSKKRSKDLRVKDQASTKKSTVSTITVATGANIPEPTVYSTSRQKDLSVKKQTSTQKSSASPATDVTGNHTLDATVHDSNRARKAAPTKRKVPLQSSGKHGGKHNSRPRYLENTWDRDSDLGPSSDDPIQTYMAQLKHMETAEKILCKLRTAVQEIKVRRSFPPESVPKWIKSDPRLLHSPYLTPIAKQQSRTNYISKICWKWIEIALNLYENVRHELRAYATEGVKAILEDRGLEEKYKRMVRETIAAEIKEKEEIDFPDIEALLQYVREARYGTSRPRRKVRKRSPSSKKMPSSDTRPGANGPNSEHKENTSTSQQDENQSMDEYTPISSCSTESVLSHPSSCTTCRSTRSSRSSRGHKSNNQYSSNESTPRSNISASDSSTPQNSPRLKTSAADSDTPVETPRSPISAADSDTPVETPRSQIAAADSGTPVETPRSQISAADSDTPVETPRSQIYAADSGTPVEIPRSQISAADFSSPLTTPRAPIPSVASSISSDSASERDIDEEHSSRSTKYIESPGFDENLNAHTGHIDSAKSDHSAPDKDAQLDANTANIPTDQSVGYIKHDSDVGIPRVTTHMALRSKNGDKRSKPSKGSKNNSSSPINIVQKSSSGMPNNNVVRSSKRSRHQKIDTKDLDKPKNGTTNKPNTNQDKGAIVKVRGDTMKKGSIGNNDTKKLSKRGTMPKSAPKAGNVQTTTTVENVISNTIHQTVKSFHVASMPKKGAKRGHPEKKELPKQRRDKNNTSKGTPKDREGKKADIRRENKIAKSAMAARLEQKMERALKGHDNAGLHRSESECMRLAREFEMGGAVTPKDRVGEKTERSRENRIAKSALAARLDEKMERALKSHDKADPHRSESESTRLAREFEMGEAVTPTFESRGKEDKVKRSAVTPIGGQKMETSLKGDGKRTPHKISRGNIAEAEHMKRAMEFEKATNARKMPSKTCKSKKTGQTEIKSAYATQPRSKTRTKSSTVSHPAPWVSSTKLEHPRQATLKKSKCPTKKGDVLATKGDILTTCDQTIGQMYSVQTRKGPSHMARLLM